MKQAAGVYFARVENEQIKRFVCSFCEKHQITGQISFDFIVNSHDVYLIECNPRATSGMHLLEDENLSLCFKGKVACIEEPKSSKNKMISLLMFFIALPRALLSFKVGEWWQDVKNAQDLISTNDDKVFFLYQCLSVAELVLIAGKHKRSIREASTMDIEWNGQNLG